MKLTRPYLSDGKRWLSLFVCLLCQGEAVLASSLCWIMSAIYK